ncbi:MAG: OmpH family outer membrane protein [Pelagibacteraceae bacterium]
MKIYKSLLFLILIVFVNSEILAEQTQPHFIDFKKVLNQSVAGKKAQDFLKNKLESDIKKFKKQEENIRKDEKDLIAKKKLITQEEYKKKVGNLRKKVSELQKNRQASLSNVGKLRAKAKQELLQKLNPIIKKYMSDNKIRIVLDREAVLLGDSSLDITSKIIDLLNKELKSLNLK